MKQRENKIQHLRESLSTKASQATEKLDKQIDIKRKRIIVYCLLAATAVLLCTSTARFIRQITSPTTSVERLFDIMEIPDSLRNK